MMDPPDFEQKQFELASEFGKYVFDHPEVDETLPDGAHVYFQIAGEEEFNKYSRELAERQRREEGREAQLKEIQAAIAAGTLVVREMTPEERAKFPPRPWPSTRRFTGRAFR